MNKTTVYDVTVSGYAFSVTRTQEQEKKEKTTKFEIVYKQVSELFPPEVFHHFQCDLTIVESSVKSYSVLRQPDDGKLDGWHWISIRAAALKLASDIRKVGENWSPANSKFAECLEMADPRIVEIAERLRAISPYPWKACHDGDCQCGMVWAADGNTLVVISGDHEAADVIPTDEQKKKNAKFIANSPEDIEYMLGKLGYGAQDE